MPADKADKLVAVKLKAAKIYYDWGHNDEALKRFAALVEQHPKSDQAVFAANLISDIYNQREAWEELYATSVKYRENDELVEGRPDLLIELSKYGEYAKFKLVNILEERVKKENGDLRLVAQAYQDFQAEFPKSENADKALLSRELVTLKNDVPALDPLDDLALNHPDGPKLIAFLKAMEFTTLTRRVAEATETDAAAVEPSHVEVEWGDAAHGPDTGSGQSPSSALPGTFSPSNGEKEASGNASTSASPSPP